MYYHRGQYIISLLTIVISIHLSKPPPTRKYIRFNITHCVVCDITRKKNKNNIRVKTIKYQPDTFEMRRYIPYIFLDLIIV